MYCMCRVQLYFPTFWQWPGLTFHTYTCPNVWQREFTPSLLINLGSQVIRFFVRLKVSGEKNVYPYFLLYQNDSFIGYILAYLLSKILKYPPPPNLVKLHDFLPKNFFFMNFVIPQFHDFQSLRVVSKRFFSPYISLRRSIFYQIVQRISIKYLTFFWIFNNSF